MFNRLEYFILCLLQAPYGSKPPPQPPPELRPLPTPYVAAPLPQSTFTFPANAAAGIAFPNT